MEKYAFNFRKTVEGKSLHISDQPVLLSELVFIRPLDLVSKGLVAIN